MLIAVAITAVDLG